VRAAAGRSHSAWAGGGGADLLFLAGDEERSLNTRSTTGARDDLRQITALLEGFRALGSGRVLQEVLELVLDAAIEISGAERAFIMLSGSEGALEFKLARGRQKQSLTDSTFKVSRKIPEEVFRVGRTKAVADLLDGGLAECPHGHRRARHPQRRLRAAQFRALRRVGEQRGDDQRIGVLYLDSREKGTLLSETTRGALETLAAEASVAIENANLYRTSSRRRRWNARCRSRPRFNNPCCRSPA
jgi:GAF domain-containing protein